MAVMVTVSQLAEEMGMKKSTLYELARRENDPLPLRTLHGHKRSSSMLVSSWEEWFVRNSELFKEVPHG